MKQYVYSIYDTVAEQYGPVFNCKNDGVAIRNYKSAIDSAKYSQDEWILYRLGVYDDEDGKISTEDSFGKSEYPCPVVMADQDVES